jgi:hypothetical protein
LACHDPDPDSQSGSADLIESGSNPDPKRWSGYCWILVCNIVFPIAGAHLSTDFFDYRKRLNYFKIYIYYLVAGSSGAGVQGGPLHGSPLRILRQGDEDQGLCSG